MPKKTTQGSLCRTTSNGGNVENIEAQAESMLAITAVVRVSLDANYYARKMVSLVI